MFFYQKHTKHIKISPSADEPPFTVKTIVWMHQTRLRKHSILLSVVHMLHV